MSGVSNNSSNNSSNFMSSIGRARHDVLLIIVTGLFILFATALAVPLKVPVMPVIV